MQRLFKKLFFIGLVVLVAVSIDAWHNLHSPLNISQPEDYEFALGASTASLAKDLRKRGWLAQTYYFSGWVRITGKAHQLKAGEYVIEPGTTPLMLLEQMLQGKVKLYTITLIEGRTFLDVMARVQASPDIKHTLQNDDMATVMAAIGHAGEHGEGMFFPDTYSFPRGMDDVKFLRRAYDAMQQKLTRAWEGRDSDLPFATPYEALIMASIVEKETADDSERRQIAGVFINRLRIGMRLQTDPTVIYGIGISYDGNIRLKDLQEDTPYNTYTRKGLPPTPIAMPGSDAIDAVMHPDATPYLYFVARGNGTGSHVFSTNLADHEAAVDEFQRKKKKR